MEPFVGELCFQSADVLEAYLAFCESEKLIHSHYRSIDILLDIFCHITPKSCSIHFFL